MTNTHSHASSLLLQASEVVERGEIIFALDLIERARRLLTEQSATPVDFTKPLKIVGYQFGLPIVANQSSTDYEDSEE